MSVYDFSIVMSQTRKLASEYRQKTGQSLPVTVELARFDAITLLNLEEKPESNNEAYALIEGKRIQILIKGRVIFSGKKSRQMVGQLSLDSDWAFVVLVIYDQEYNPVSIYCLSRQQVEKLSGEMNNKRGSMTVAKFKAMGDLVWHHQPDENPKC